MSNNIYKCKICGYTEDYVKLNGKITFIKKYELCRPCYMKVYQRIDWSSNVYIILHKDNTPFDVGQCRSNNHRMVSHVNGGTDLHLTKEDFINGIYKIRSFDISDIAPTKAERAVVEMLLIENLLELGYSMKNIKGCDFVITDPQKMELLIKLKDYIIKYCMLGFVSHNDDNYMRYNINFNGNRFSHGEACPTSMKNFQREIDDIILEMK